MVRVVTVLFQIHKLWCGIIVIFRHLFSHNVEVYYSYGAVRCGAVCCGVVRCGAVQCGSMRFGSVRFSLGWVGLIRVGSSRVGSGRIRLDLLGFGNVGLVLLSWCCVVLGRVVFS